MGLLRRWLGRHPLLKAAAQTALPWRGGASRAYKQLDSEAQAQFEVASRGAWQSDVIPARQRRIVDEQLAAYRNGIEIPAFDALVGVLRPLVDAMTTTQLASVLEVGCSSGYHNEVFELKQLAVAYQGCDYSTAFIRMAKDIYPDIPFVVADATALPDASESVDIVVSGCCLLHIANYEDAISEAARVARRYVIFHRTPVIHTSATTHFRKLAYDVQTVEIHFNEQELVSLFAKHGLSVIGVSTLDLRWKAGDAYAMKEYVCEKNRRAISDAPTMGADGR
jgi:ubiquinone/menaquinone biosynthesis C-methylase UbiE